MKKFLKKQLILATIVYWILLLYIIAALVWWFIALQQQNQQMKAYKLVELNPADPSYVSKVKEVHEQEQRKTTQYIGEGSTFLLLILVGAVFVYRSVRKEFRLSQEQQNFMMAVTHELKTPIAVTKLNLETLLKHKLEEQKQQKLLQMTLQETERLNDLSSNILISAQLEGGGYTFTREELDLSALTMDAINSFRGRFPDYKWEIDIEDDLEISGDPFLLQIMINNLAENAIKYSPHHSSISITLKKNKQNIELQVKDEGPGVPEEEKKKIFRRFYRVGSEKVRATKGTGLGLYLCKKIAEDHHADITVKNNHPAGSIFCIRFKQLNNKVRELE
jgi:two-component system sensor histidine kinase CiaH